MSMHIRSLLKPWTVLAVLGAWSLLFTACSSSTEQRNVVSAPAVAGATFVGAKECVACHSEQTSHFETASHARMSVIGTDGKEAGSCEACHGPASLHVSSGDGKHIVNPKNSPEACFRCHIEKRASFSLPNSHPVLNGKMSCLDCHEIHQGKSTPGTGATSLEGANESCTKCHSSQQGPFVFPHQAIKEGCMACHSPHGSVNSKMLNERDANLCQKCHQGAQTVPGNGTIMVAGDGDHRTRMIQGTCWSAGCHEAVHGSNINAALRY